MINISVIIPCYNSEKNIEKVVDLTVEYLSKMNDLQYEFVLVNDCSPDNTFEAIRRLTKKYSFVKGINLAKNAGQHNALITGLKAAEGEYFLAMDDDGQTHPSQIYKLIDKMKEGYDVVYGVYKKKKETGLRRLGSDFNNYTVAKLIGKPVDMKVSSYWLIKKFIRDEAIKYPSNFTNMQGIFLRATAKVTNVEIEHFDRLSGTSGYTLKKLLRLWSSDINYSMIPLRFAFHAGLLLLLLFVVHVILFVLLHTSENFTANIVIICMELLFAFNFLGLGMLGEYLGRMFMVIMNSPQAVVKEYVEGKDYESGNYRQ